MSGAIWTQRSGWSRSAAEGGRLMMKLAVVRTSRVCVHPYRRTSDQKSWVRKLERVTSTAPSSAIEYTLDRPATAAIEYGENHRVSAPMAGMSPGMPTAVLYIWRQYCMTPLDGPVVPEVRWMMP